MATSLEAKICVLGAQGVGKTSLVQRYVKGTFTPSTTASTVGASFLTKRVLDIDSGMTVRLQLWDTAGQERFRSISKLYYRGASAVLLVYSIVDEQSFQEMGRWMQEVKENVGDNVIVHVVGTKSDVVASDPGQRMVPFERCIAYVAENFFSAQGSAASPTTAGMSGIHSLDSKRSSGIWGQDTMWDCCHEISAKDGEGIEEVFRVITRKLVDEKIRRAEQALTTETSTSPGFERSQAGYFDGPGSDGHGSFRVGIGDKRRSWLGFPTPNIGGEERDAQTHDGTPSKRSKHEYDLQLCEPTINWQPNAQPKHPAPSGPPGSSTRLGTAALVEYLSHLKEEIAATWASHGQDASRSG
ncbi:MAG: hypothetical protein Q9212_000557 [Teloschistes hypoglaucus]